MQTLIALERSESIFKLKIVLYKLLGLKRKKSVKRTFFLYNFNF